MTDSPGSKNTSAFKHKDQYYRDYLQLDTILNAQHMVSSEPGNVEAHDEMLFIITHQAYELWFKQVLFEVEAIIGIFSQANVAEKDVALANHYLNRINRIMPVLISQFDIIETMTPSAFTDFRSYLNPASGFQSLQFRLLEIGLGLRGAERQEFGGQKFHSRLDQRDRDEAYAAVEKQSLLEVMTKWLERMPFLEHKDFTFSAALKNVVHEMYEADRERLRNSSSPADGIQQQLEQIDKTEAGFDALFDKARFEALAAEGNLRLSMRAAHAVLFIFLYKDYPLLQMPYRLLTQLIELDENMAIWRFRHAQMVSRMIGSKIGTGGSSGHSYLIMTADKHRVFTEISNISSYLIPSQFIPALPADLARQLEFNFES